MSFEGKISGSLAPQGAMTGNVSGSIGAVVPDIRDESVTTAKLADEAVTTAKLADAAVTIAKLAADVTALINSKGDASDVAQLQEDVAALQTITAGLGTASTYGVANNLTQAAAGVNVLDAAQGKVLNDKFDQQSSTKYQGETVNGITWYAARVGKVFIITALNGETTEAVSTNAALVSLSAFPNVFISGEKVLSPCDTLATLGGVRLKVNTNSRNIYSPSYISAGTTIRAQIVGIIS